MTKFEDNLDFINTEISKRRIKWNLTALSWIDFDDVSQILRIHIYKKWRLYDQSRPLAPWVNRVISSQIKNLIRNNHGNYVRPCLKCAASEGESACSIYGSQCNRCPLYSNWERNKKSAYDIKLPLPLENHTQEVFDIPSEHIDIEKSTINVHNKMKQILKPIEWKIYKHLYIDHVPEQDLAKLMGYKTSEKNRTPGYKRIKNIKKIILIKAKKCIFGDEVDIV